MFKRALRVRNVCFNPKYGARYNTNSAGLSTDQKPELEFGDTREDDKYYEIHSQDPSEIDFSDVKTLEDAGIKLRYRVMKPMNKDGIERRLMSLTDYFGGNHHNTHHVFYPSAMHEKAQKGRKTEKRTFMDLMIVRCRLGRGGNGCVSFFRDANRPTGPPDGGDGGPGGDVLIRVIDSNAGSLHRIKKTYEAKCGTSGRGDQLDGARGQDVVLEVPVGTTLRWIPEPFQIKKFLSRREGQRNLDDVHLEVDADTRGNIQIKRPGYPAGEGWSFSDREESWFFEREFFTELRKKVMAYDAEMIATERMHDKFPLIGVDFDKPTASGKPITLLKGGSGGMGNMHFLTKDVRNPRFSKRGREGVTAHFLLELKLIADLGLVGLPNAGKLTLLRAISRAKPRIGHWEFTTLQPTIGTIQHRIDTSPFTVADIPGIIKGASENKGMGLDFLRHIERCRGLVFVVSLESHEDNHDLPVQSLQTLMDEVGDVRMEGKRVLVVATKADLTLSDASYQRLCAFTEKNGFKIVPVCAERTENIDRCVELMHELAQNTDDV